MAYIWVRFPFQIFILILMEVLARKWLLSVLFLSLNQHWIDGDDFMIWMKANKKNIKENINLS